MPLIEEFDVVIKTLNLEDIKQLFGEGRKDVRVKIKFQGRMVISTDMKIIIETWERKQTKDKA